MQQGATRCKVQVQRCRYGAGVTGGAEVVQRCRCRVKWCRGGCCAGAGCRRCSGGLEQMQSRNQGAEVQSRSQGAGEKEKRKQSRGAASSSA